MHRQFPGDFEEAELDTKTREASGRNAIFQVFSPFSLLASRVYSHSRECIKLDAAACGHFDLIVSSLQPDLCFEAEMGRLAERVCRATMMSYASLD